EAVGHQVPDDIPVQLFGFPLKLEDPYLKVPRVVPQQSRGDHHLRVALPAVALRTHGEAQVPVTGDLCQQGPADLGHVEGEVGVLQDAEVELAADVGQVVGVVAGGRVGQVERVVA